MGFPSSSRGLLVAHLPQHFSQAQYAVNLYSPRLMIWGSGVDSETVLIMGSDVSIGSTVG